MKAFKLSIIIVCVLSNYCFAQKKGKPKNLFNGKNLSRWHIDVPEMDNNTVVKSPFIIRNEKLVSLASPMGHIITDAVYQNFELMVQYRFANVPGNCGVLVHCSTPRVLYKMFPKSIEAQLMHTNAGDFWCIGEDIEVPKMEARRGPKENWGVTEDKERCVKNLTDNSEKPLGEWNIMKVQCYKDKIKVWVNNTLVNSAYNCTTQKGQIALQAEGSEVEFKSVVLRKISGLDEDK
jgi:Domain of Unknown Function (DUF1080)